MRQNWSVTTSLWLGILSMLTVPVLTLLMVGRALTAGVSPLEILLLTMAAFPAADVASGMVHWFFDTYGHVNTPVFGAAVIAPFREHHRDQKAILHHGFLETNGNSFTLGLLTCLPLYFWTEAEESPWLHRGIVFFLLTFWQAILANQVHKYAHAEANHRIVRGLQRWHLFLSPEHHAIHHRSPYDRHYCIANGSMNRLLDFLHFWRGLEMMLRLLGLRPAVAQK